MKVFEQCILFNWLYFRKRQKMHPEELPLGAFWDVLSCLLAELAFDIAVEI